MGFSSAIAKKIAAAQATAGGNYIKQGRYVFEVKKLLSEQKDAGAAFIAELLVVQSEAITEEEKPNPVGSTVSYVQLLDKHKSAPGNTKAFVLTLMGEDESQMSADDFIALYEYVTNDDPKAKDSEGDVIPIQPARGMLIACETYRKPKKEKKDEVMTLPRWATVSEANGNSDEQIATRRKAQAA